MAKKVIEGTEEKTLFQKLYEINVNDKLEKKANLSYLSWAFAWAEVKKVDPAATAIVHEFPLIGNETILVPYLQTPTGFFVKVSVTIHGQTETEWLPVMDHRNKTMEKPTAFDINKNTKRCLVKAIALHGLGLYVYAGEDLPEDEKEPLLNPDSKEVKEAQQQKQEYKKPEKNFPLGEVKPASEMKNFAPLTPDTKALIGVLATDIATKRNTDILDTFYILLKNPNFVLADVDKWTEEEGKNFIIVLERWIKKLDGNK